MTSILEFAGRARQHKEARRFVKFALVGTIGAIVDFTTYNILLTLFSYVHLDDTLATAASGTISFLLAITSNFIWNRYWTYPDSRTKRIRRQFVQFFLVNVTALLVRLPVLTLTYEPFTHFVTWLAPVLNPWAERIGKNLALALAVGIAMFWNFFVNRYWTYNDVE